MGGVALLALCVAILPDIAHAQGAGGGGCSVKVNGSRAQGLLNDVKGLISGPFGATIGLVISLFGAYQWLVNQSNWGLVILAGGALLTVFPGVYANILNGICNALPDTIGKPTDQLTTS